MIAVAREDAGVAIGVDIGGTKVFGVVVDAAGTVLAETRLATPQSETNLSSSMGPGPGEAVADAVAAVVDLLCAGESLPPGRSVPLGVGAPGMVDRGGVLRFAPNLPAAAGADLRSMLAARLPRCSVTVENDANCAAVAERTLGALRGVRDGLMVTLGTGIGGGLLVGGEVRFGAAGFAGEVGHMIVDPSGPPCPCGRRGCWERYASGGGLGRLAREAAYAGRLHHVVARAGGDPENVHGEDITTAARAGDEGALSVLEELGWWVALGLANLVAVTDPQRCVIGGGLAEAGELLFGPTRRAFQSLVEGAAARPEIDIVRATLGERSGAVGAALVARSAGPS